MELVIGSTLRNVSAWRRHRFFCPCSLRPGPYACFYRFCGRYLGNNAFAVTWAGGGTAGFYGTPVAYEIFRENVASTPTPIATVSYAQSSYTDYAVVVTPSTNMSYQYPP